MNPPRGTYGTFETIQFRTQNVTNLRKNHLTIFHVDFRAHSSTRTVNVGTVNVGTVNVGK